MRNHPGTFFCSVFFFRNEKIGATFLGGAQPTHFSFVVILENNSTPQYVYTPRTFLESAAPLNSRG